MQRILLIEFKMTVSSCNKIKISNIDLNDLNRYNTLVSKIS